VIFELPALRIVLSIKHLVPSPHNAHRSPIVCSAARAAFSPQPAETKMRRLWLRKT
jgi:hypothetical protein